MDVSKEIVFNTLLDWRKETIDPLERAQLISRYQKEEGITQSELAKKLGIPKSTLKNWLIWSRIDRTDYERLKKQGMGKLQIQDTLVNKKDYTDVTDLDVMLDQVLNRLRKYYTVNVKTIDRATRLRDDLTLLIHENMGLKK